MNVKVIEVRDVATRIIMLAVHLGGCENQQEIMNLRSIGYGYGTIGLTYLAKDEYHTDPYKWSNSRILQMHKWVENNYTSIKSGDVVDIEYILGEVDQPKTSDFLSPNW